MAGPGTNGANRRLRISIGVVLLVLVAIVVLVDIFGRLFVDGEFRVSDLMLSTLIGALLVVAGLIVPPRRWFPGGGDLPEPPSPPRSPPEDPAP